jgi:hypothetical protein
MKLLVEPIFKKIQIIWLDKLAGNICKNKKKCMAFSLKNKSLGNCCSNFSSNDMSLDFLSFHFLNTTFDLVAIKANGQWLVLLFFNYHRLLTVKQIIN